MRVVWGQHSGESAAAKEEVTDKIMDAEDELSEDSEGNMSDDKLVKNKPNKKKKRPTTIAGRAKRHLQHQKTKKERLFIKSTYSAAFSPDAGPVSIDVDHPGLEASIRMMVLRERCTNQVSIEWTSSNMRALYRMCENDNSCGETRKAHKPRQHAKLGGAAGSGFFLRKYKNGWRKWMAKGAVGNERHLPSHLPTQPPFHPSTPLHSRPP